MIDMNILLNWADLDGRRLADGDRIEKDIASPEYSDDDPRRFWLFVRIELGPGVSWWKQAELTDFNRNHLASAEVQDSHSAAECHAQIFPPENGARWLTLWKGKAFGVHTRMYDLTDLGFLKGKLLILRWLKD
jgi:hypothetical protein